MKSRVPIFLIIILILFSCRKEEKINIDGTWDISFVITTDIHSFPSYKGEMILVQDDDYQVTGSIELYDDLSFYAFTEILPGGFVNSDYKIAFESYVWLSDNSISTLTLDYSGTFNAAYNHMGGIFKSGENKIGNWTADKR
jgi:hypothetical protein